MDAALRKLDHEYTVVLSDEELSWSQEHACRALQTMRAIPHPQRGSYGDQLLPRAGGY